MKISLPFYMYIALFTAMLVLTFFGSACAQETGKPEFESVEERRVFALMEQERQQLQQEKKDLELREKELKTLEASVDKRITLIDSKLAEMKALQNKIESLLEEKSGKEKKRIKDLSAIYEKMAPASAASAMSRMEPSLATDLLANMKPEAAAKILDKLDRQKTSELSTTFTTIQLE